jgi:hypothetical protein
MVIYVSKQKMVILFTEGLFEPLRGWVKDFKPNTLQEAIMKTQDMEEIVPKKTSKKIFIP